MGLVQKMSVAVPSLAQAARSPGDPRVLRTGRSSLGAADRLAKGLGWFSIALGVAEIVAPRRFTRAFGVPGREGLVRLFGVREVVAGMTTLSVDKGAGLWSRVAGDALDLAALAAARNRGWGWQRANADLAIAAVIGVTVLDLIAAQGVAQRHRRDAPPRHLYRDRTGYPGGVEAARGAARGLAHRAIPAPAARAATPAPSPEAR